MSRRAEQQLRRKRRKERKERRQPRWSSDEIFILDVPRGPVALMSYSISYDAIDKPDLPDPAGSDEALAETRESLYAGIAQARAGNRISDIARAVQETVESAGFSVVTDFAGHGIGRRLHEDPQVPNYFRLGMPNPRLREGMALAIEPMVNEGSPDLEILSDGWTAVTADGKLSAHFEHSIAITSNGPEILSELENV